MIPNVGTTEVLILLAIVLLVFGAKRIPELAKGLGSGVREFRRGVSGRDEIVAEQRAEAGRVELSEAEEVRGETEDALAQKRA